MRAWINKLPLRVMMMVPFTLIIIVAVGMTSYLTFRNGQASVDRLVDRLQDESIARIQQHLDSYLSTPWLINQLNLDSIQSGQLNVENLPDLKNHFRIQLKQFNLPISIAYADEQGNYIGVMHHVLNVDLSEEISTDETDRINTIYQTDDQGHRLAKIWESESTYDPRTRPWYQSAALPGESNWSPIFMWLTGEVGLDAVAPVYNQQGKLLGVLDTSLTLKGMGDFLQNMPVADNGQVFIIERSGLLVASSNTKEPFTRSGSEMKRLAALGSTDPVTQAAAQALRKKFENFTGIHTSQKLDFDLSGVRYLLKMTPYQDGHGLDWLIVVIIPQADFMDQIKADTSFLLLFIPACLLAAIFIAILTAWGVTQPLERLNQSAKALAEGHWNQKVIINRGDEIGELAHSFNDMAAQIQNTFSTLQASEERYRTLFNRVPVGLFRSSPMGEILDANPATVSILGYSDQETLLKTQTIHFYVDPQMRREWQALLENGDSVSNFETQFYRYDGKIIWVMINSQAIRDDQGQTLYYEGYLEDITERKELDEKARSAQRQLMDIIEFLPDATFVIDNNHKVIAWNHAMEEMTGVPKEAMLGKGDYTYAVPLYGSPGPILIDFVFPSAHQSDRVYNYIKKIENTVTAEIHIPVLNGQKDIHLWGIASPLFDRDGHQIGAIESIRDITERKHTERVQAAIYRISEAAFATQNLDELYQSIHTIIGTLMPAGNFFIGLFDPITNQIHFPYHVDEFDEKWDPIPPDGNLTGYVLQQEEPLLVTPTMFKQFVQLGRVKRGDIDPVDWLGVPLKTQHGVIGVMVVQTYNPEVRLGEVDKGILTFVSTQVAMAIERKRVQEALRESEQKLNNIIQGSPIPMFVINKDHLVTHWNKALEECTQIKAEAMINTRQHWRAFYSAARPCMSDLLVEKSSISTWYNGKYNKSSLIPEAYQAIDFFPNLGNTGRWLSFTAAAIRDSAGSLIGAVETLEDITEEKKVAEALRESEERYRLLVETMHEGLIILNEREEITYCNQGIGNMLGYLPEEVVGWKVNTFFEGENEDIFKEQWQKRKEGTHTSYEIAWTRKNGENVFTLISPETMFDKDGHFKGSFAVITDITDRKRAEEQIHLLNLELEKRVAERTAELELTVKELDAFSHTVSHDLRAPLRAMDGYSRILIEDFSEPLPAEAQKYLGLVVKNSRKMDRLINDLLMFSRTNRTPLKKRTIILKELVCEVLEDLKPLQEGRQIEIVMGDLPDCEADSDLLKQVFTNLLSNAIKFTRLRQQAVIEIGCQLENDQNVYFVRDNGAGFDMTYADKLFGVFQRFHSDKDYEGTGVGLSIVQRIILRHGGRIWAYSEVDHGTTFYLTLG